MAIEDKTPVELAGKWEKMVSLAAQRLNDKRKKIKTAVGARPYRGVPVSEAELLRRYSQVRHDPQGLAEILKQNVTVKSDGRTLVPKALIEAMTKMEIKLRKEGVE